MTTKRKKKISYLETISNVCFTSSVEPKNVKKALKEECWVNAMQEDLEQFERNKVWTLVPRPKLSNTMAPNGSLKINLIRKVIS